MHVVRMSIGLVHQTVRMQLSYAQVREREKRGKS